MSGRPNPFEFRVPESPPPLAPGPSAYDLSWVVLRFYAFAVVVVISIPFLFSVPYEWHDTATEVAVVLILLVAGLGFRSAIRQNQAVGRERDAGYTTLYGSWLKLWQLDPKTGEVLRRPGEPAIPKRRGGIRG
jgi:hypothetical protein